MNFRRSSLITPSIGGEGWERPRSSERSRSGRQLSAIRIPATPCRPKRSGPKPIACNGLTKTPPRSGDARDLGRLYSLRSEQSIRHAPLQGTWE
jgi:hypothetical protein